jgi:hypothetical protein
MKIDASMDPSAIEETISLTKSQILLNLHHKNLQMDCDGFANSTYLKKRTQCLLRQLNLKKSLFISLREKATTSGEFSEEKVSKIVGEEIGNLGDIIFKLSCIRTKFANCRQTIKKYLSQKIAESQHSEQA